MMKMFIILLYLVTFVKGNEYIPDWIDYAHTVPDNGAVDVFLKLNEYYCTRTDGHGGCMNNKGYFCGGGLACNYMGNKWACEAHCQGNIAEGGKCMYGPCLPGYACIKGKCETYNRTAYLLGEYYEGYDRGGCPPDYKYCLKKGEECLSYHKKTITSSTYDHRHTPLANSIMADYCIWPYKCVSNPEYGLIGGNKKDQLTSCDGTTGLGQPCIYNRCDDSKHTCFHGLCTQPINIGKICDNKDQKCNTLCTFNWRINSLICQLECSPEKEFCQTSKDCCPDLHCVKQKCARCIIDGCACEVNNPMPCCDGTTCQYGFCAKTA